MARTPSIMVDLGSKAIRFQLPDTVSGQKMSLDQRRGSKATVIMFICNHCPYVKHALPELINIAQSYGGRGVSFIAISSNDASAYPEDSPEKMKQYALDQNYPFPYLYDESQEVARAYQATCTPDLFVYDADMLLAYRGQMDDSRPGNEKPITGKDLRNALDCLITGQPVPENQVPSIGCSIKWKKN